MENNPANPNENGTNESQDNGVASLEAKIKQLESENGKLKQSVTNASADASSFKKQAKELEEQLKSKLSDEENAKRDQEAATAALQKELEDLRNERNIANYTAALSASDIGMDAENAKAVAEALNSGNTEKVFAGIRSFIVSHDKALAEKAMLNNPKLPGGNSTKTVTKEQFNKMGYREMLAFKTEHPDLFEEYSK